MLEVGGLITESEDTGSCACTYFYSTSIKLNYTGTDFTGTQAVVCLNNADINIQSLWNRQVHTWRQESMHPVETKRPHEAGKGVKPRVEARDSNEKTN